MDKRQELVAFVGAQHHAGQLQQAGLGEVPVDEDDRVVGSVVGSVDDEAGARGEGVDPHAAPLRGLGRASAPRA